MGYAALGLAIVLYLFTFITSETSRTANQALYRQTVRDANTVASQILNLSQYIGHWRWENPTATALPAVSSLGLPFKEIDNRIHYALSGGRLWVWVAVTEVPGVEAELRSLSLGSGQVLQWRAGALLDSQGKTISTTGLTIPSSLSASTATQLIHLN